MPGYNEEFRSMAQIQRRRRSGAQYLAAEIQTCRASGRGSKCTRIRLRTLEGQGTSAEINFVAVARRLQALAEQARVGLVRPTRAIRACRALPCTGMAS